MEIPFLAELGKKKACEVGPAYFVHKLASSIPHDFFFSWFDEEEGPNVTKLTDFSSKNFQNPPIFIRTHS